jgi:hypothetical protein
MPVLDAMRCVQKFQIKQAHLGKINSLREIEVDPFGFVTTGEDKHVRVWSKTGELWGDIDLLREKVHLELWNFPYNWHKNKQA